MKNTMFVETVLLLIFTSTGAHCQVKLTSSSSTGYVCEGSHVTFSCEATGNFLTWLQNENEIVQYVTGSSPVQKYGNTDIYSVLLSENGNIRLSELVFMVSPPRDFKVQCWTSGNNFQATTIAVLGNTSTDAPINVTHSRQNLTVTLKWKHVRSYIINFFEIMLDNEHYELASGDQTQMEILLPECRDYEVYIVAVDYCNHKNASETLNIACSEDSTTATMEYSETTSTMMSSTVEASTSARVANVSDIKHIKDILIAILFFVLLHFVIHLIIAVYTFCKDKDYIIWKNWFSNCGKGSSDSKSSNGKAEAVQCFDKDKGTD